MNELEKVELLESEISIIEQNHKSAILSIHENMNQLVNDCVTIVVEEEDKESYDKAVELKRIVKATHVSIEKKRKELKQPLIDYGKRLDKWVEIIYTPLVNAEKIVKNKMEVYEAKQEKLKQERKLVEDKKQQEELELEVRLKSLNNQLEKINSAKNKAELKEIEVYLDSILISDFGSKSNEAGFILNQLKLTCSMASRLMKDEEIKPVEEVKPVEVPKVEPVAKKDDFLNELKEMSTESIKSDSAPSSHRSSVVDKVSEPIQEEPISEKEQVVLMKDDNGVFEEKTFSNVLEPIKASDDDVISIVDHISMQILNDVISLIDDRSKSFLNNAKAFDNLDFSEYQDLIDVEVKKRIGILLSK